MASPTRRILLTSVFAALSGAAVEQPGYPPIPPPRVEVVPAPRPGYIWRPGHWRWDGGRYLWVPGAYLLRQHGWHAWVEGHWAMRGGRWVWIEPHWR